MPNHTTGVRFDGVGARILDRRDRPWRGRDRGPHDELEGQFLDERNRPDPSGQRSGEDLRPTLTRRLQRLAHGGQAAVGGDVDVVVADDRHIARHRPAGESGRLEDTDRLYVGGRDDRRRRVGHGEQLGGELACRRANVRTVLHVLPLERHTGVGEGQGVPRFAVPAGDEAERVALRLADERDALVAQRQEVFGGDPAASAVVDDDARHRRVHRVDQHDRELRVGEPVTLVGAQRERDDDQPIELCPWKFHQASPGAIRGVDVVQHDLEAVRLQRPHDAAQALVRGGLVEVRHEHPDEPLPSGPVTST